MKYLKFKIFSPLFIIWKKKNNKQKPLQESPSALLVLIFFLGNLVLVSFFVQCTAIYTRASKNNAIITFFT